VQIESRLEVAPLNLDFGKELNEASFVISNTSSSVFNFEIEKPSEDWLRFDRYAGSVPAKESVTISGTAYRSGLDVGTYTSNFHVTSGKEIALIKARMEVTPNLVINPSILDMGANLSKANFTITNSSNGYLDWQLTENYTWLRLSKAAGSVQKGELDTVQVTVDRMGLLAGPQLAVINVTSNGGNAQLNVKFEVPDYLRIEPTSLDFGGSVEILRFNITNIGDVAIDWKLEPTEDWLQTGISTQLDPWRARDEGTTFSERDPVDVKVDRENLTLGTHNAFLNILSSGGLYSMPISIRVIGTQTLYLHQNLNLDSNPGTSSTANEVKLTSNWTSWILVLEDDIAGKTFKYHLEFKTDGGSGIGIKMIGEFGNNITIMSRNLVAARVEDKPTIMEGNVTIPDELTAKPEHKFKLQLRLNSGDPVSVLVDSPVGKYGNSYIIIPGYDRP
jgi:hypothetical protein